MPIRNIAQAEKNTLKYLPNLNKTYVLDSKGQQIGEPMDGDQRQNPGVVGSLNLPFMAPPSGNIGPHTISENLDQMSKDFVVNAVGAAPMAFGPEGAALSLPLKALLASMKIGGSFGASYGADRLLTPERPQIDSAGNAAVNTALNLILPGVLARLEGPGRVGMAPKTSIRTAEPTTINRMANTEEAFNMGSKGTRTNIGESTTQGSGTSTMESQGTRTSSAEAKSSASGTGEARTISRNFEDHLDPSPEIDAINSKLKGLKTRLEDMQATKQNQGVRTTIKNTIDKYQEALDAMEAANTSSGNIRETKTKFERTGTGTSATEGNTSSSGKGTRESNSTTSASGQGVSTTEGTRTGERSTEGTQVTTPGKVTTETHGENWHERLFQTIIDTYNAPQAQYSKLKKFIIGMTPADAKAAVDDLTRK